MSNFHVGQKVVCVNADGASEYGWKPPLIKKGHIYTIREIGLSSYINGRPCIRLAEVRRGILQSEDGFAECDTPYYASRFRPVIERKTDISIFRRMLVPSKQTPVNVESSLNHVT